MPEETGPWWVQDKETGHKYVAHVLGEHLTVLEESPYTTGGDFRDAEPNVPDQGSTTKSRKEAAK